MSEKTIFDYLNSIYLKKPITYDKKICNSYMLSMWLSHDNKLIEIVNNINKYQFSLDGEILFKYYFDKIPQGKRYIKWVKKTEVDKKKKEAYDKIKKELNLSDMEFNKYLEFKDLF
jgi:hypothetical protein